MKKSSTINKEVIKQVANLAYLYLKKAELLKFKSQLSKVFAFFETVNKLQTKKLKLTSHTLDIVNRFREDKIDKDRVLSQEEALSQAKNTHKGYFLVKSVFKNE